MRFLRRLLGAVVLLLSTLVFVGSVVGVVAVWKLRQDAVQRVEDVTARLDAGLDRAVAAAQPVHRSLETIHKDVEQVKTDTEDLEPGKEKNRLVAAYFRTVAQRLATYADASGTAASLLREVREVPFAQSGLIDPDRVDRAAGRAAQLAASARKLQTDLGGEDKQLTEQELLAAASEADAGLQTCGEMVTGWQSDVGAMRAELPAIKSRVLHGLTLSALALTVLCAWVGVSQVSLFAHGWKWYRGR